MNPHQPDRAKVQARYNAIARWYDMAAQFTRAHRSDAVRALNVRDGLRILDLACGTGINFEYIIAANNRDVLLGLDYSLGLLEQAQTRLQRTRWDRAVLSLGSAAKLPFAAATFDRVLCTYALKAIPPYQQTLDEVARVLKPDGLLVVMDAALSQGATRFLNPLIQWMTRGFFYEIDRPIMDEIARRFQMVQTAKYDFGHTLLTVARKSW